MVKHTMIYTCYLKMYDIGAYIILYHIVKYKNIITINLNPCNLIYVKRSIIVNQCFPTYGT